MLLKDLIRKQEAQNGSLEGVWDALTGLAKQAQSVAGAFGVNVALPGENDLNEVQNKINDLSKLKLTVHSDAVKLPASYAGADSIKAQNANAQSLAQQAVDMLAEARADLRNLVAFYDKPELAGSRVKELMASYGLKKAQGVALYNAATVALNQTQARVKQAYAAAAAKPGAVSYGKALVTTATEAAQKVGGAAAGLGFNLLAIAPYVPYIAVGLVGLYVLGQSGILRGRRR